MTKKACLQVSLLEGLEFCLEACGTTHLRMVRFGAAQIKCAVTNDTNYEEYPRKSIYYL